MGRVFGSPPRTAPSPPRGGQVGRAVFSALPAWAAEVVSSNIVGYTKVSVTQGLNLLAAPFAAVGGETADINDLATSSDLPDGSVVRFWDAVTRSYSTAVWYSENADGGVYTDDSYEECLGAGWGDDNQIIQYIDMPINAGYWLQTAGSATVTLAGEVDTSEQTASLVQGLNLLGNPYPCEIPISSVVGTSLPDGSIAQFWNATSRTYTSAVWYSENADGGVYTDDSYEDCLGAGWGDDNQIVVNETIGAGEGFWVQTSASSTITFVFPSNN